MKNVRHSAWLQITPARFKQVYSDSAVHIVAIGIVREWIIMIDTVNYYA
jgi:hypothetical protein